jgi:peptidoglycan/LPS O-acetylase OafA/YrhL
MDGRIVSLEYMRGIAALMVVYAHVVVVGTTDAVTPRLYFPGIAGTPIATDAFGSWIFVYLWPELKFSAIGASAGHIGVSLFFLVSGYVIIRSVEKAGAAPFLIGRIFRIIPLCLFVTVCAALIFTAYNAHFGQSSPYTWFNTLASSFLVPGWLSQFQATPILWSLIVEACFYLLVAATYALDGRITLSSILMGGLLCTLIAIVGVAMPTLFGSTPMVINATRHTAYNACFVIFILIGSTIYVAQRPGAVVGRCIAVSCALLGLYGLSMRAFDTWLPGSLRFGFSNGPIALVLFVAGLAANDRIGKFGLAKFFADISYPLYLVHIPLAWVIMFEMYRRGISSHVSIFAATVVCIAVAYALHRLVEQPSHQLGARVARRLRLKLDARR